MCWEVLSSVNLQTFRLVASNFTIKWTTSQVFFNSILSPSMLPPCIDLGPPSNFEEPPHVLNTCKKSCRYFQNFNESWYYMECCSTIFSLISSPNNKDILTCCTSTDNSITQWIDLENDQNNSLSLKHSSNLDHLVNKFNNVNPKNSNDPEKISSSKYYDIEEMCNIEIHHKNKLLSLFHINACSLNKNFDELQHLLSCALKKLLM